MVIPTKPRIVLLSSPGYGHLIPILHLAQRLVTHHSATVTVFVITTDSLFADSHFLHLLQTSSSLFNLVLLPLPLHDLPISPHDDIVTRLALIVRASLPDVRAALVAMRERPSAMVVDLFTTEAIKVAEELGMIKYVFAAQSAWFLAQTAYYPYIEKISLQERVQIPGCVTVPADSLSECIFVRRHPEMVRMGLEIATADGVLVNTWEDLDRRSLESFRSEEFMGGIIKAPVLAVGPLVRGTGRSDLRSEVMEWLDKQPAESVLLISFGTGGTLTTRQTIEMAWGLEMSHQRFVWVIRQPLDYDASASQYFESKAGDEHLMARYLPEGFLDRTKEKGKVVPLWVPQAEILAHGAVGGFLSHCGWNSTLESLVNGVPMIGWPLYAEQDMNATMLAHEIRVAVRPEARPSWEVIRRAEIETMIREVMVGEDRVRMRSRAKELKNSAEKALGEGGTSSEALAMFVKECEVKAGFMAKNGSDAYDRMDNLNNGFAITTKMDETGD